MSPAEWKHLGHAVVLWSGYGVAPWPARRWELLDAEFGVEAGIVRQRVRDLATKVYSFNARYEANDLIDMGDMVRLYLSRRCPELPLEAVEALAWCYTFDYK